MDAAGWRRRGSKSARHLLRMLLRALDYLPPVELEFADVIDSVLTADRRLAPDDDHDYRDALQRSFAAFGITPPAAPHRRRGRHGRRTGSTDAADAGRRASRPWPTPPDPDTDAALGLRYEHLNLVALRTSPEEVYQFIWNNAAALEIDVRLTTRVERVLASTRVGPDGLVVNEIIADYIQILRTTGRTACRPASRRPTGMAAGHGGRAVGRRGAGVRPVRPVPAAPAQADPRRRPADPPAGASRSRAASATATAASAPPTAGRQAAVRAAAPRTPTEASDGRGPPQQVRLRAYKVGFGDCLLLTVTYGSPLPDGRRERHVLIDCGSTAARRPGGPALAEVAAAVAEHCGGRLDVVVATHPAPRPHRRVRRRRGR